MNFSNFRSWIFSTFTSNVKFELVVGRRKFQKKFIPKQIKQPRLEIFRRLNLLSINRINAQIKLTEVWKSQNIVGYPTKWEIFQVKTDQTTRSVKKQHLTEPCGSKKFLPHSFVMLHVYGTNLQTSSETVSL